MKCPLFREDKYSSCNPDPEEVPGECLQESCAFGWDKQKQQCISHSLGQTLNSILQALRRVSPNISQK